MCTIIMVHKASYQFSQIGGLYWALIVLGLAVYLPSTSVSSVFVVLYIQTKIIWLDPFLHLLMS